MAEAAKVPDNWREPSAKAAREIDEQVNDWARDAVHVDADKSEFLPSARVFLREGERDAAGQLVGGSEGVVIGAPFTMPNEPDPNGRKSRHAGKVCRAVLLDDGRAVHTPEERLSSGRLSVGFSGISQERWDHIFGRKRRRGA